MIVAALPKMMEKATSAALRSALQQHLEETRQQLIRLDRIFDALPKANREGKKCRGMEGIIEEGEHLLGGRAEPEVLDAGIIAAAQKVEHYEIATYGTVRTYADLLGKADWAQLLEETLNEEKSADAKLNKLAAGINPAAQAA
jgi:ferritin-like metal-binding protein YciE